MILGHVAERLESYGRTYLHTLNAVMLVIRDTFPVK